jgi:hypothetical protein
LSNTYTSPKRKKYIKKEKGSPNQTISNKTIDKGAK